MDRAWVGFWKIDASSGEHWCSMQGDKVDVSAVGPYFHPVYDPV